MNNNNNNMVDIQYIHLVMTMFTKETFTLPLTHQWTQLLFVFLCSHIKHITPNFLLKKYYHDEKFIHFINSQFITSCCVQDVSPNSYFTIFSLSKLISLKQIIWTSNKVTKSFSLLPFTSWFLRSCHPLLLSLPTLYHSSLLILLFLLLLTYH